MTGSTHIEMAEGIAYCGVANARMRLSSDPAPIALAELCTDCAANWTRCTPPPPAAGTVGAAALELVTAPALGVDRDGLRQAYERLNDGPHCTECGGPMPAGSTRYRHDHCDPKPMPAEIVAIRDRLRERAGRR